MKTRNLLLFVCLGSLLLTGCGEEAKIDSVKKTVVNNCKGKTMQDLASGLLQNPVWGFKRKRTGENSSPSAVPWPETKFRHGSRTRKCWT
ncbi:MAG: hypothetical protein LBB52_03810 [Desulfovibrio sp.]|nr:hypothetical protein [Desulfovibrio sp.]